MTASAFEMAIAAVRGGRLAVAEDQCINLRGRDVLCSRCAKACPADALGLSADEVTLADADCTGCGACVPACPAGVFRLPVFDPERFLESLDGRAEVHLHCSESNDRGGGVVIPCHLLFDARLAAAAVAEGARRFVLHGTARCKSCRRGDARPHIDSFRRALGRWFGDAAPDVVTETSGGPDDGRAVRHDQVNTDRRGFLRLAGVRAASAAAWLVPMADEDEEPEVVYAAPWRTVVLAKQPAAWRAALSRRLRRLPWAEGRRLPWHVRSFDESCTGCMACAERCPTGALHGTTTEAARSISFDPALCTNCTLCQRICPQDSVRPRLARSVAEASATRGTLMHMALRRCPRCGTEIAATGAAEEALCVNCTNEREMDDEWLEMLEG